MHPGELQILIYQKNKELEVPRSAPIIGSTVNFPTSTLPCANKKFRGDEGTEGRK